MLSGVLLQLKKKKEKVAESLLIERTELAEKFHGLAKTHLFQNQEWQNVNSEINFAESLYTRFVSLGSDPQREKLFIDSDSIEMSSLKQQAELKCQGKDIMAILLTVCNIINNLLLPPESVINGEEKSLENRLKDFLAAKKMQLPENELICLHLDNFIKEQILVCRHRAIMAVILLADLVKKKILPPGIVRHYRSILKQDTVQKGAHAVAIFRDKKTGILWLCDPTWNVVKQVNHHLEELVEKGYGNVTLGEMIKRLDAYDVYQPLKKQFNRVSSMLHFHPQKSCYISAGTEKILGQHLRIEFAEERYMFAFAFALKQQQISFQCGIHGKPLNTFIMIFVKDNPAVLSVKMVNLHDDFNRKLAMDQPKNAEKMEQQTKSLTYALDQIKTTSEIKRSYSEDNAILKSKNNTMR